MKTEHTTGDWKVGHIHDGKIYICVEDEPLAVALSFPTTVDEPSREAETQANARLILAAPKMFAVLKRLRDSADLLGDAANLSLADEAIKEADALIEFITNKS
jgi:hypothetical protein